MNDMKSEAFYYPYMNIHSNECLKAMVLYFDKIYVMRPEEASIKDSSSKLKRIESDMDTLEFERVVHYISPSELLIDYDDIMTRCVLNDITNPDFLKHCSTHSTSKFWEIYAEKLPTSLADSTFRKYLLNIPNFYSGQQLQQNARLHERRHSEMYEISHFEDIHRERRYRELRIVKMPFEVGESLMINHALCACDKFSLTPVADYKVHHSFLLFKFRNMQKTTIVKKLLVDYGFIKDMAIDLTSVEVISETIPMLYGASISDILDFRDENKDALQRFKIEIGKVVTEAKVSFWDEEFNKKIINIVDSKVRPSIQELKDSVESVMEKFIRILKRGATVSSLPIIATLLPGFHPAIALAAGGGVATLDHYLESIKRKRKKQKNGFAFLYNALKKFSSTRVRK